MPPRIPYLWLKRKGLGRPALVYLFPTICSPRKRHLNPLSLHNFPHGGYFSLPEILHVASLPKTSCFLNSEAESTRNEGEAFMVDTGNLSCFIIDVVDDEEGIWTTKLYISFVEEGICTTGLCKSFKEKEEIWAIRLCRPSEGNEHLCTYVVLFLGYGLCWSYKVRSPVSIDEYLSRRKTRRGRKLVCGSNLFS